jgi:hypothetical protein
MTLHKTLHDLCPSAEPADVFAEIRLIVGDMAQPFDFALLDRLHADIQRLFAGTYPGYQASNTKYHDLKHTYAVVLAVARILDGLRLHGQEFAPRHILLAVCCAFFHDSGLIQHETDRQGTGAKYTIGHEERSIKLMRDYLGRAQVSEREMADCAQVIRCTILSGHPRTLEFHDPVLRTVGLVLGAADLLAQMCDRHYLEKLPDLFTEFQEGGLPGYDSEMEIINKTEDFYHSVAIKRLQHDLNNIGEHVHLHFLRRWGIDQDLYTAGIDQNIAYLRALKDHCLGKYECYRKFLRRGVGNGADGDNDP